MAAAQVGDRALDGRQHLVVGDRHAVLAQPAGDRLRADVAAVGEQHQRPPGGADPLEHLDARPADGRPRPSGPRWTSVPSTSNTNPRTSSSRRPSAATAPHHPVGVLDEREMRDRSGALAELLAAAVTTGPASRGVAAAAVAVPRARDHRVDLLGGHRQAEQQLLLGDPAPEPLARASRLIGSRSRSLRRLRARRARARRSRGRPAPAGSP